MHRALSAAAAALWLVAAATAGELTVLSVEPVVHRLDTPADSSVTVNFDRPVLPASVNSASFRVFGRWSGSALGSFTFAEGGQAVTLEPESPFFTGESVVVMLSHDLLGADGSPLRSGGYTWSFTIAAGPGTMDLRQIDEMTTRTTPGQQSRAYGGTAPDLDRDGHADLVVVNEISADLRVFLNRDDGSGLFDPFIQPTFPVNTQASPSETADFDGDGFTDVCVANVATDTVSVLLGAGDGTFGRHQEIDVGNGPYGLAVLDVDGDGDADMVCANSVSGDLSLMLNDGTGAFGKASTFPGGGSGERTVQPADMNEDGIFDLVVGAQNNEKIIVHTGNGDGTFTQASIQDAGGAVRKLALGDVNGDGHVDVASVNEDEDTASILMGNGDGTLDPPDIYTADNFPGSTDLGDLDGDGDLDWVVSNFLGDWMFFRNQGDGTFTLDQALSPPSVGSCSILVDLDNDGVLDVLLVDEIPDVVLVMLNTPDMLTGDVDGDGDVDVDDLQAVILQWGPCPEPGNACPADIDGDGRVGIDDLVAVLTNWTG